MTTRETIKRFTRPATIDPGATIRSAVWQAVISLQGPINAFFIGVVGSIIESKSYDQFVRYMIYYGFFMLAIHIFLEWSKSWGRPQTYFQQMRFIQDKYLKDFVLIDGNYLDKIGTGKLIAIINTGFDKRTSLLFDSLSYFTSFTISLLSGIYFSYTIGWEFIIGYLILFGLIVYISNYFDRPSRKRRNKRRDALNEYSRALVRFIMSKTEIIQNDKVDEEISRTGNYVDQAVHYTLLQTVPQSRMFNIPRIILNIFRVILYVAGSSLYFDGKITLSELTAMLGFMLIVDEMMIKFIQGYKNIVKDRNKVEKLWSLFDDAPKDQGLFNGDIFIQGQGNITISNVSYEYVGSEKVFDDLTLSIKGGTKTALVGPSGGGKSTLIKLIAGYIRPDSGSVIIDGQDLQDVSLKSYYKHIGYLTQEPSVFDGTVWENLTYGLQGNTEEQDKLEDHINHIIKLARCEFVHEFKDGLQTEIGEKGVRLSGGQRQRLAIAKIMLKDPDIILLDEPTSALDSENEELVTQALNELFKGKTVIVIAHRLQTVKHSDQILYIDGGQVMESGTHEELLAMKGKYSNMVELQSGF